MVKCFVNVKVSDGKLLSREYVARITVSDVNIAPVIIEQRPDPLKVVPVKQYSLLTAQIFSLRMLIESRGT